MLDRELTRQPTHLFTGRGALCGAKGTYHWSLIESAVSCPTCRALLEVQRAERRHAERRVIALTRVLQRE